MAYGVAGKVTIRQYEDAVVFSDSLAYLELHQGTQYLLQVLQVFVER